MSIQYIKGTKMLDFRKRSIQKVIEDKGWSILDDYHKIKAIYEYVQNDILFGYNASDNLTASEVLRDGYGQCNTKATLLMAFLRGVGIPTRLHGAEVIKDFQRGALPKIVAALSPKTIVHTWVEVLYKDAWYALEGVIIDKEYLKRIKQITNISKGEYFHYAIATTDFTLESVDWKGEDTFIQKEAIRRDLGIYDTPDEFFSKHQQHFSKIKNFSYKHIGSKYSTRNVKKIRKTGS